MDDDNRIDQPAPSTPPSSIDCSRLSPVPAPLSRDVSDLVHAARQLVIATNHEPDQQWAKSAAFATERALAKFDALHQSFSWYASAADLSQDEVQVFHARARCELLPPAYLILKREHSCKQDGNGHVVEAATRIWFDVVSAHLFTEEGCACTAYYSRHAGIERISLHVADLDHMLAAAGQQADPEKAAALADLIATELVNSLLEWAQRWPHARISPIRPAPPYLTGLQSRSVFYGRFGLQVADAVDSNDSEVVDGPQTTAANIDDRFSGELRRVPLHVALQSLLLQAHALDGRTARLEAQLYAKTDEPLRLRRLLGVGRDLVSTWRSSWLRSAARAADAGRREAPAERNE